MLDVFRALPVVEGSRRQYHSICRMRVLSSVLYIDLTSLTVSREIVGAEVQNSTFSDTSAGLPR